MDALASPTRSLLITIDVEDHTPHGSRPRFREALAPLLDALGSSGLRATFFVVGALAADWGDELRGLPASGHEIALHGFEHRKLRELGPKRMAEDLRRGVGALGDLLGHAPAGYRAPYFGLTRDTPWAPDLIRDAGFTYSSSVLPAWNPQAGFPGAPRTPFRWPCGLLEFPSPVFGFGPVALPLLGGAYLRLAPLSIVRRAARSVANQRGAWLYAHPYDFDCEEPFHQRPGQSKWFSRLLFARRDRMFERVIRLTSARQGTMEELASDPDVSTNAKIWLSH